MTLQQTEKNKHIYDLNLRFEILCEYKLPIKISTVNTR